jgi:RNA polymerase sigma factor (sigma-70 family)
MGSSEQREPGMTTSGSAPAGGEPAGQGRGTADERRQLTNVAYRLLGSLAEAEDAVQEAYARWYAMTPQQQQAIESPVAWLTTVTSRICLDLLGSARARRERYVGEWIPEPLPETALAGWRSARPGAVTADPADRVTLDESVSMAFLVVLESLTPAQRVALILHDVFGYQFAEVAEITGRSPAACRQLATSARRRLHDARTPRPPAASQAAIVSDFRQAWQASDVAALVGLLDPDAVAIADGGGLATAVPYPIQGASQIAGFYSELTRPAGLTILERTVNGQPGLVVRQDGVTTTVLAFDIRCDKIFRIWAIRNPDKLRPWTTD